jgi:rod shape-determining protein MreD
MIEHSDTLLTGPRKNRLVKFRPLAIVILPLLAILYQIYTPQFLEQLSYLELPLLVAVYFSLMWRSQIRALFFGAAIGLLQDSLSREYLGMFGIAKTLVGYFAASMSLRFDVDNSAIRFILAFFFYAFHQCFYWVMVRALLGLGMALDPAQTIILAGLNAAVAVPLFLLFDKLKES